MSPSNPSQEAVKRLKEILQKDRAELRPPATGGSPLLAGSSDAESAPAA